MLLGLHTETAVERSDFFTIWKIGEVVVVRIWGNIDDERARRWVEVTDQVSSASSTRFAIVDVSDAKSETSLSARMHVAHVLKRVLQRMEWGVGYVGEGGTMGVVARIVLRVMGLSNVSLIRHSEDLERAWEHMRQGDKPPLRPSTHPAA